MPILAADSNSSHSYRHIVAIGGCHLGGHLVGAQNSLTVLLASRLNLTVAHTSRPTAVHRCVAECDRIEEKLFGALVVLQLGNYETARSLLPKLSRSSHSSGAGQPVVANVEHGIRLNSGFLMKAGLKMGLSFCRSILRVPEFKPNEFEKSLSQLLDRLLTSRPRRIVLLTPFPSAWPHVDRNRRWAASSMKRVAARNDVCLVDTFEKLKERNSLRKSLILPDFADPLHLNLNGHKTVADEIVRVLRVI